MSDLVMTMSNFIFSQCFYLRCIFMFLLYSGNKICFFFNLHIPVVLFQNTSNPVTVLSYSLSRF